MIDRILPGVFEMFTGLLYHVFRDRDLAPLRIDQSGTMKIRFLLGC
ncbi:MAG: hypothetical protein LAT61_06220 [Alcanivorax sp.]|nr:hypothetical protein [Alcanivorax sp.]